MDTIIAGFDVIKNLLFIGVTLFLGFTSLKTLRFLFKEWKEGRSYFMIHSRYSKFFEVLLSVLILGGLGTLFVLIAISGLIHLLL